MIFMKLPTCFFYLGRIKFGKLGQTGKRDVSNYVKTLWMGSQSHLFSWQEGGQLSICQVSVHLLAITSPWNQPETFPSLHTAPQGSSLLVLSNYPFLCILLQLCTPYSNHLLTCLSSSWATWGKESGWLLFLFAEPSTIQHIESS